jgi:hypothetical protein
MDVFREKSALPNSFHQHGQTLVNNCTKTQSVITFQMEKKKQRQGQQRNNNNRRPFPMEHDQS